MLFLLAAALTWPVCAQPVTPQTVTPVSIHGSAPIAAPVSPCALTGYAGDNGCAASTTYVAAPFFHDANVAQDTAETGQLPTSPTQGEINQRNSFLHYNNENFAYADYRIGSENPASLTPVSSFPSDTYCSYSATGGVLNNGGPHVLCNFNTSATVTETIERYDFSNTGAGTGTGCAELDLLPVSAGGPNVTVNVIDDFFQANLEGGVTNNCWQTSHSPIGNAGGFIYLKSSGVNPVGQLNVINVWMDGNTPAAIAHGVAPTDYEIRGVLDNRTGPGAPGNGPINVLYSGFVNLGHIPIFGVNGSSITVQHSIARNDCLSGSANCHGEWAEYTGGGTIKTVIYVDANVIIDSVYNTGMDWTTAYYWSSGASNNSSYAAATATDAFVISNNTACTNNAGGGFGTGSPYGPNLPCVGGSFSISAMTAETGRDNYITAADIERLVLDNTAALFCYYNTDVWASVTSANMSTSSSAPALDVIAASPSYSHNLQENLYPGMYLWNSNGSLDFVPTTLGEAVTYVNASTGAASVGTMDLNATEPNISANTTWHMATDIATTTSVNNYTFGGAYGTRASPALLTVPNTPNWGGLAGTCP